MNDFEKNVITEHSVQCLCVSRYTYVSKNKIIDMFGVAPDWFEGLGSPYWEDTKRLIDWILNNTTFRLVGVSQDNNYINYYFTN